VRRPLSRAGGGPGGKSQHGFESVFPYMGYAPVGLNTKGFEPSRSDECSNQLPMTSASGNCDPAKTHRDENFRLRRGSSPRHGGDPAFYNFVRTADDMPIMRRSMRTSSEACLDQSILNGESASSSTRWRASIDRHAMRPTC